MEFIFKPEKLTPDFAEQVSYALAKRTELASRKKFPGLWKKTDALNEKKMPEDVLRRRKIRRVIYGIFLITAGIFLFVPGLMNPKELFVPLAAGTFSLINGIFAVLPRKTPAEKYEKKAKRFISAINASLKEGDTVVFGEEAVTENGGLLMEYKDLEPVIENRRIWLVCDGKKLMILRKADLVLGSAEDFSAFIKEKTGEEITFC